MHWYNGFVKMKTKVGKSLVTLDGLERHGLREPRTQSTVDLRISKDREQMQRAIMKYSKYYMFYATMNTAARLNFLLIETGYKKASPRLGLIVRKLKTYII